MKDRNKEVKPSTLFTWNGETEFGEPQAWYSLPNGQTIEICFEQEGMKSEEFYYSMRVHCSDNDFDENRYEGTCGVLAVYCGDAEEIYKILSRFLTAASYR